MKKTICITGASSGFGASCARRFAREGCQLILAARRTARLSALERELAPAPVHVLSLDVQKRQAVHDAFATLPESFQAIDVLINSAGLALGLDAADQANLDDWDRMIDTNIKGVMYCTRAVLPTMVARDSGHIVNLGSIAGSWPYPGGNVYGATKAFVKQFSNNLRADVFGTRIRVTNIEPGMAKSEFSLVRFKGDAQKADRVYEGVAPLTSEDIAEMIYWVTSLPAHVNVNRLEVMPTCQSWGALPVYRDGV